MPFRLLEEVTNRTINYDGNVGKNYTITRKWQFTIFPLISNKLAVAVPFRLSHYLAKKTDAHHNQDAMEEAGPSHGPRSKCTESLLNVEGAPAALDPSLRDSSRLVICLAECVACRLSESAAVRSHHVLRI